MQKSSCGCNFYSDVRREGVTEAAGNVQRAGECRGRITVLDRPGPDARSCECYAVVKKEFDRLLPEETSRQLADSGRLR